MLYFLKIGIIKKLLQQMNLQKKLSLVFKIALEGKLYACFMSLPNYLF